MSGVTLECLVRQFDTASRLASYHLDSLTTEECLWRPASRGLHVHRGPGGSWHADWPDREDYGIGPPSIAWLTWHVDFWWSMVLAEGKLTRDDVVWPGSADLVRERFRELEARWRSMLAALVEDDIVSTQRTHWPFKRRPFADVIAWVNIELTKNAAEIGYARFLYATKQVA